MVSRFTWMLEGGQEEHKLEIVFSARTKQFFIVIPEFMQGTLGRKEVSDDTLDKVNYAFREAVKDYKERITRKEKVIFYSFEANAYEMDTKKERCIFSRKDLDPHDYGHGKTGMMLWWTVGFIHKRKDRKQIEYFYENGTYFGNDANSATWDKARKYMPWSERRELFFAKLEAQMISTIKRATMFFEAETDTAAKFIDTGGKFALPNLDDTAKEK